MVDVSIILNCHDEVSYLNKTLRSLDLAITYALINKISVELIAVFDNPTEGLEEIFKSYKFKLNFEKKIIRTCNSSLGLSRNEGVANSKGKYIWTADADDLVSENSIVELFRLAEKHALKSIDVAIYPQYVFVFGLQNFIYTMFNSDVYSAADYAYWNPFNSKLFIKRKVLVDRPYKDLNTKTGFAFEDWEYNTYLYDKKIPQVVANNVVLYYRQRSGSIMRRMDYIRVTPDNHLFDPLNFVERQSKYHFDKKEKRKLLTANISKQIKNNVTVTNDINLNSMIEPEISMKTLDHSISSLGSISSNHWANQLSLLFKLTGCNKYDFVFLFSKVEKFNKVIDELLKISKTNFNVLVIYLGEDRNKQQLAKLADLINVNVLFFKDFFDWMLQENKENLILRLLFSIQNSNSRLVVGSGCFENKFLLKYSRSLINYYQIEEIGGDWTVNKQQIAVYRSPEAAKNTILTEYQRLSGKKNAILLSTLMMSIPKQVGKDVTWDRVIAEKIRRFPMIFYILKRLYHIPYFYKIVQKLKDGE